MARTAHMHDGSRQRKTTSTRVEQHTGKRARRQLTDEWLDRKGKPIELGNKVRTEDGVTITVIGRWTKHLKDGGMMPMVTGTARGGAVRISQPARNMVLQK